MNQHSNIKYLQSDSNYTTIYFTDNSKRMICKTLKKLQEALAQDGFIRVHHSYLVNFDFVEKVVEKGLLLKCKTMIPISRKLSRTQLNFHMIM